MRPGPISLFASLSLLLLAACAEQTSGPLQPRLAYEPGTGTVFNERDFEWSRRPGSGAIDGVVEFNARGEAYSCSGEDVILTPETPWVMRRMYILYGSVNSAAVPVDIVRARTPSAGASGDYASYARKTSCDASNRFSFSGLAAGGWYVLTLARPVDGGPKVAVMRRVQVGAGMRSVTLD